MWNPTELLFSQHFEASLSKRRSVCVQRGNINFLLPLLLPAEAILQRTSEKWKPVVHVNDDANSAWYEQIEYVLSAIQFLPCAMRVPDCVYAENEIKQAFHFRSVFP